MEFEMLQTVNWPEPLEFSLTLAPLVLRVSRAAQTRWLSERDLNE